MSCCGSTSNYDCNNPCTATQTNTATCEALPSALENFIKHFFGSVIKTESGGQVTWSLPCNLEVGLPANPREPDEGLACYFLRLFDEGITGLVGPKGDTGDAGTNGNNAYSVTTGGFTQPTIGAPTFSVKMAANPAIMVGSTVFIQGSGWHTVTAIGGDWTVFLTLLEGLTGVTGALSAGRVVTVTGPRGLTGVQGVQGIQGVKGDKGDAGDEYTPTNGFIAGSGSNFSLLVPLSLIQFSGTEVDITLPDKGLYYVEYIVGVVMDATAASSPPERLTFRVWNASSGIYENSLDQSVRCFGPSEEGQIIIRGRVNAAVVNTTLQLYGQITVAGKAVVIPARTSAFYMRMS